MKQAKFLAPVMLAASLGVGLWSASAAAAVPNVLTQQGRLLDSSGAPVSGTVAFVFSVYDAPMAGNVLWTESQMITLDNGYFSAQLGDTMPIPTTVFTGPVRYLGVKVATDPEMTPRQPLVAVPYAITANDAIGDVHANTLTVGGVKVIDATGKWVGPSTGLVGATGATGPTGATGAVSTIGVVSSGFGTAATSVAETATCSTGQRASGGGCTFSSTYGGTLKENEPNVTTGTPTGWVCECIADTSSQSSNTCNVEAFAVCVQ
jgi:hypothetical protein